MEKNKLIEGEWLKKSIKRALPCLVSLQLLLGPGVQTGIGGEIEGEIRGEIGGRPEVAVPDISSGGSGESVGAVALDAVLRKSFITFRGRDREGRPYAIDSNGVICTYRKANARELELVLSQTNGVELGSIEYHRVSSAFGGGLGREGKLSGISVTYRTAEGTSLSIGNTGSKERKDLELDYTSQEFGRAATLKGEIDRSAGGEPQLSGDLSDISSRLRGDSRLLALLKASGSFLSNEGMSVVLGKPIALFDPGLSCLRAGAMCLCMAAIYISAVAGLVMACGGTVGVGCYAAIAIHPAVCCEVAEVCSAAVDACESPCIN